MQLDDEESFRVRASATETRRFPRVLPPATDERRQDTHRRRLLSLTGRDYAEPEARELWDGIARHRQVLARRLGRDPGLDVAAFDYLKNVVSAAQDLRIVADEALDRLRGLARTDSLTGILNRRGFDPILARERARAKRQQQPLAVLLIDVDHFKRVNDTFGHLIGDRVLARLANLLVKLCRESDVVARYGGDEFVLLLPSTDKAGAERLGERIRETVAATDLTGLGEQERGAVSVSIGLSVDDGATATAALATADAALYQAKRAGRNRVAG